MTFSCISSFYKWHVTSLVLSESNIKWLDAKNVASFERAVAELYMCPLATEDLMSGQLPSRFAFLGRPENDYRGSLPLGSETIIISTGGAASFGFRTGRSPPSIPVRYSIKFMNVRATIME